MAEAPEHQRKTLEDFRQQLAVKVNEAARVLAVVNAIEEQLGLPRTSWASAAGGGIAWAVSVGDDLRATDSPSSGGFASTRSGSSNIRPDEYLGDPPLEAAKKYLRRVRQAAPLDEIAEAISRGGAATRGADWKGELDASLLRSTREVVKVKEGTYGLVEFYTPEQLTRLRSVRRQRPEKRARRRGRPKGSRTKKRKPGSDGSRGQEPSG